MKRLRIPKNLIIISALDLLLLLCSIYTSYWLRFDFSIPTFFAEYLYGALPFILLTKIIVFHFFDLYRGMWRYAGINDLINVIKAATLSSMLILVGLLLSTRFYGYPRSAFVIDWCLTVLFITGLRLSVRLFFELATTEGEKASPANAIRQLIKKHRRGARRLIIVGAGNCAETIFREIRGNTVLNYHVVGFLDDNPVKHRKKIHGVPVLGAISEIETLVKKRSVDEVLIAIPSATAPQMRRIVDICKQTGLPFKTIPSYGELINGRVTVNSIREVAYSDLLRREVVKLDEERIGAHILGKVILVTGAAGSIGSELCRQICRFRPGLLILFERSESPLYDLELELNASYPHIRLQAVLGDILDVPLLEATFDRHQPHMVFHAAAYKHVPMLENQPWRAVINNIVGTRNVVDNACRTGVNRFVFVSTDKAVRPANIMGATKCVAEKLVQCCCLTNGNETKFMTVRFGNVVGSIGSVVPLFKKQIAQGGPVTVTHPEVTRFFMTIPEASQLILQAGAMGEGGEIYVLKMGTAIKIDDMARDLIHLSGFEPDVDIKIEYIGLRPGEKLYEELISEGEGINPTGHDKILVLQGVACDAERLDHQIEKMQKLAAAQDGDGIRALLSAVVPEFKPSGVPEDRIETDSDSPADTIAFPISSSSS